MIVISKVYTCCIPRLSYPPPDLSGKVGKLFKSQKWGTEKKNEKGKEKRKRGRKKGGGEKMRKKEKIKAVKRWGRISRCWEGGWGRISIWVREYIRTPQIRPPEIRPHPR